MSRLYVIEQRGPCYYHMRVCRCRATGASLDERYAPLGLVVKV